MNSISITGVIKELWEMSEGVMLCRIHSLDDNNKFYLYWSDNEFNNEELRDKYVSIVGKLEHIQVRTNENIRRLIAIHVREMEIHDF